MAFTSIELVRTHLASARFGDLDVRDTPLILNGTALTQLPHQGINPGSIRVKARMYDPPARETRALDNAWAILGHAQLIPGTVVVARDSSLGIVYAENVDFVVDYAGGRIRRTASSAIANGQTVTIWHGHFHVYSEGDDYELSADSRLRRLSSGAIADGQSVLVDYAVDAATVSDAVIEQGISESAESVLALVNPVYHDEPAPGIVIGATHWAVAQVARMRAAAVLADAAITSSAARAAAQIWLDIAGQYEQSGRHFLARFANPAPSRNAMRRG